MRVGLITLGCDKNTVDNEYLAGLLQSSGCDVVAADHFAGDVLLDAVVVATCGFVGDAKEQSIESIVAVAEMKRSSGNPRRLYVSGCLAQRYASELLQEIPEIDGIVGVGQFAEMAAMIRAAGDRCCLVRKEPVVAVDYALPRTALEAKPYAYLKIADGCNHRCAFCAIPAMKGPLRSVPPDILLDEARRLLARGARELNLIAQDITAYGQDRDDMRLPDLLRALGQLDGAFWIRCLYAYPGGITEELIDAMATTPHVVPYLDMPIQHFDLDVLRRMNRPAWDLDLGALLGRLRGAMPGISLRTTLLIGFPGETPAAHRRLIAGLRAHAFHWVGAFPFSCEEGTAAAAMPRHVGMRTRRKRWQEAMECQADISAQHNEARVGTRTCVLMETFDESHGQWAGRTPGEAPEADGSVYMEGISRESGAAGQFVEAEIVRADGYDIVARPVEQPGNVHTCIPQRS